MTFYNTLIQTFLNDESLFTDVKAIVDCPLKVEPAILIKACREREPKDIIELLGAPGSDLDHPVLIIPDECVRGRNSFLDHFDATGDNRRHPINRSQSDACGYDSLDKTTLNRGRLSTGVEPQPLQLTVFKSKGLPTNGNQSRLRYHRQRTVSCMPVNHVTEFGRKDSAGNGMRRQMIVAGMNKDVIVKNYFSRIQRLGQALIQLWPKFYRQVSPNWSPDRNSLIPVPRPFIVPGGRFIEIYYWDSYWILRGLLSSGLTDVARDLIENFLYCVERFGFIPNGLRKYYLDRSQPPLLSSMLRAFYHSSKDEEFLRSALPLLEKEYEFWMDERLGHAVTLEMPDPQERGKTKTVILNRYYSLEVTPRPESYRIDQITGNLYQEFQGAAENIQEHYRAIRAGAESGWDFSSRWLRPAIEAQGEGKIRPDKKIDKVLHKVCLVDIDTCNILPCDLNAYLFCIEQDLVYFARLMKKADSERKYTDLLNRRKEAMLYFLWDSRREIWLDYDIKRQKKSCVISAASFVPLWAGVNPEVMDDARRIQLVSNIGCIVRSYGVVATNVTAGLQWDTPNVWAPNQHIAVDFLCGGRFWDHDKDMMTDNGPAATLAALWASSFINTVLDRFELFGTCAEKYDATRLGKSGVDGEYVTQDGFGWTNGTVLDFLEKFTTRLTPEGLYRSTKRDNMLTTATTNF